MHYKKGIWLFNLAQTEVVAIGTFGFRGFENQRRLKRRLCCVLDTDSVECKQ